MTPTTYQQNSLNNSTHISIQSELSDLIKHLNFTNLKYAVLSDIRSFPKLDSDIDICVENITQFIEQLSQFCSGRNLLIIRADYHATGIRFDVAVNNSCLEIIQGPDVLIFPTWLINGDIGIHLNNMLTSSIVSENGIKIPTPSDSFLYYLIKRIDKKSLSEVQFEYLMHLWSLASIDIEKSLSDFFTPSSTKLIKDSANKNDWAPIIQNITLLHTELQQSAKFSFTRHLWKIKCLISRFFKPTGLFVAIFGPDGSGKSSVISTLKPKFDNIFRSTEVIHLRPRLGQSSSDSNATVNDPHAHKPRGVASSILKLLYFFLDYWIGYLSIVRPRLIRTNAVIFDRYYHDLLIDPRRYRYGGPAWLAKLVGFLIPKPDLFILLDASPEILQGRKQEVPFAETARQRDAYLELFRTLPNGVVVDASQPIETVTSQVCEAVLKHMAARTAKRLHLDKP